MATSFAAVISNAGVSVSSAYIGTGMASSLRRSTDVRASISQVSHGSERRGQRAVVLCKAGADMRPEIIGLSANSGCGESTFIRRRSTSRRSRSLVVCAAKLPAGVEAPAEEPNLPVSLWGFTESAEVWNSRAAMIGIVGLIALEFFASRGILEIIGVDVGKGLDIPL